MGFIVAIVQFFLGFISILAIILGFVFGENLAVMLGFVIIGGYYLIKIAIDGHEKELRYARIQAIDIDDVDNMSGSDFEYYVAEIMAGQGFNTSVVGQSGDMGVDVVAEKNGSKYAVQVKRHSSNISRRAVSDAVAGKNYYDCTHSMVVTNSYYTKGAVALSESTGCILVDREKLAKWVIAYRGL